MARHPPLTSPALPGHEGMVEGLVEACHGTEASPQPLASLKVSVAEVLQAVEAAVQSLVQALTQSGHRIREV